MVVFKCLLSLLVFVLFLRGNYCKPHFDEHRKDNGIGSTLWGWVTYINPWGSDDNTSESTSKSVQDIISTQSNDESIAEARLLTAATRHVNPTTAVKPASKHSLELQTTTPIILAQSSKITKNPTAKHFMESNASTTAISSAQINLITSEISAQEPNAIEFEPNASTIPIPTDEDILKTTQVPESEHYLEEDMSTTPIVFNQDIPTTTEEYVSTTLIVPVKENPTTTEEPLTEHYLDLEMSISLLTPLSDQDIFTTTNEPVSEEPLDLEESIIVTHTPIPTTTEESTTERPLESEPIEPAIEYQPPKKLRTSNISNSMDENNNEGPLEVEVPIISETSDSIEPIQVSYPEAEVAVTERNKVFREENQDLILTDFSADSYSGKEIYVTGRYVVPTEENEISILSVSTSQYPEAEAKLAGRDATNYTKVNKESFLTEPVTGLYSGLNVSVLERDEVSTEESEITILTEFTSIFFPKVAMIESEGLTVKNEPSNQHEPAKESTVIDEMFILTDSTPDFSTGKDTSALIEHSTNPLLEGNIALYKLMYGVPTEADTFTAIDGVSAGTDAVSSEVDSVITAVDAGSTGVDRTVFTKVDRAIATPHVRSPKSSTTYNEGLRVSFDYRLILLCPTMFLVMF